MSSFLSRIAKSTVQLFQHEKALFNQRRPSSQRYFNSTKVDIKIHGFFFGFLFGTACGIWLNQNLGDKKGVSLVDRVKLVIAKANQNALKKEKQDREVAEKVTDYILSKSFVTQHATPIQIELSKISMINYVISAKSNHDSFIMDAHELLNSGFLLSIIKDSDPKIQEIGEKIIFRITPERVYVVDETAWFFKETTLWKKPMALH